MMKKISLRFSRTSLRDGFFWRRQDHTERNRDMFLIPTDEICKSLGVPPQLAVRMRKACYGLVEARIEWFETMNDFLKSIGFEQLRSDPCFWR